MERKMGTSGDLAKTIAAVLDLPEVTVSTYLVALRKSGLITQAGRGSSAADMSATDAIALLTVVAGGYLAKDSVETYKSLAVLPNRLLKRRVHWQRRGQRPEGPYGRYVNEFGTENFIYPPPLTGFAALPAEHTFSTAFAALMAQALDYVSNEGDANDQTLNPFRFADEPNSVFVRFFLPGPSKESIARSSLRPGIVIEAKITEGFSIVGWYGDYIDPSFPLPVRKIDKVAQHTYSDLIQIKGFGRRTLVAVAESIAIPMPRTRIRTKVPA